MESPTQKEIGGSFFCADKYFLKLLAKKSLKKSIFQFFCVH